MTANARIAGTPGGFGRDETLAPTGMPAELREAITRANRDASEVASREHLQPYEPRPDEERDWVEQARAAEQLPRHLATAIEPPLPGLPPRVVPLRAQLMPHFPFPWFGAYVPAGWKKVAEYFVDASGVGSESDTAITVPRFIYDVLASGRHAGCGFAICEAGPQQVVIGVFRRTNEILAA